MTDKPILFSGPMVRAILEGRKTMTRMVVKPQPHEGVDSVKWVDEIITGMNTPDQSGFAMLRNGIVESEAIKEPYRPGDRLWVKETFMRAVPDWVKIGKRIWVYKTDDDAEQWGKLYKWTPSILMPRKASRITLEVTGVRVERLQEITHSDACAEGMFADILPQSKKGTPIKRFEELWDSIYALPQPVRHKGVITHYVSYPWEDIREIKEYKGKEWLVYGNPWVWVNEFKRVETR